VHDELTCIVKESQAKKAKKILQDSMENNRITKRIDIPILAEPIIAKTLDEAK
jgi:DNA polymerase I-like protein with 3'-5' exonuclease and polymerase domains